MNKITSVEAKLKRSNPNYSDRIDKMVPMAKKIADSKDPFESMSEIVPTLDAFDAYVLGMVTYEFIKDGTINMRNGKMLPEEYNNTER